MNVLVYLVPMGPLSRAHRTICVSAGAAERQYNDVDGAALRVLSDDIVRE